MSIEAIALALHHSKSKGIERLVLLGICNHDGDGGAWPSIATLVKYSGMSERRVQQAIRALEDLGEIRTMRNAGGTSEMKAQYRPNRYAINLRCPRMPECDGTTKHRKPEVQTSAPLEVQTSAGPEAQTSAPESSFEPSSESSSKKVDADLGPRRADKRAAKAGAPGIKAYRRLMDVLLLQGLLPDSHDLVDTYRLLMEEHSADWPGAFADSLHRDHHWDGFIGRHLIAKET